MKIFLRILILCSFAICMVACETDQPVDMAPVRDLAVSQKEQETHVVDHGETLYSIAWRFDKNVSDLARINHLQEPYQIRVGQVIRLEDNGATVVGEESSNSNWYNPDTASSTSGHTLPPTSGWVLESDSTAKKPPLAHGALPTKTATSEPVKKEAENIAQTPGRWHWPAKGRIEKHDGIDIYGKIDDPIYATDEGTVVYSGDGLRGYGKLVILKHEGEYLSAYGHNSKLLVSEGDRVKVGQKIAEMGRSGTDDVKLHFEIRKAGKPQDPLQYLPKLE